MWWRSHGLPQKVCLLTNPTPMVLCIWFSSSPIYLYIHDERFSEGSATDTGHYHWRYVRSRLDLSTSVILEQTESPKEDSSPHSEPNLKLKRMSKDRESTTIENEDPILECTWSGGSSLEEEAGSTTSRN